MDMTPNPRNMKEAVNIRSAYRNGGQGSQAVKILKSSGKGIKE
jgi:hypothetical protein